MSDKMRGTVDMTAAMVISGTIGLFVVLSGQPVMDVVFWRCAFGAVILLIVCAALGLFRSGVMSRSQIAWAAVGGIAIVSNWILLFAAFPRASISIATAVYNTQPFMLVALGAMFFGERLTLTKLTWLGIAFGGMLMIVQAKSGATTGTDYLAGILLALGAAFFYAIAAIITKKLKGVPPHLIALIQVTVGILMLAPFASFGQLPTGATTWALLVAVGVIHTGVMYILLYGAIQKLPTNLVGALSFIYPVVAIVADFLAFGHRLQPLQIIGAAAILVAAAGMTLGWSLAKPRLVRT
ncbi:DMT family transporter [Aminobacter aganoensis]|uniref:Drug/metabolite transporter (DMT)-like permease n=1 Tax=Aminobacter aganoensis TaxID=83264 RepID=A0A7X0F9C0_9HYPH|nr:DMT family transporter [Aminobacter aganoensis]MBB6355526.1 drug/metabolite transporter (DMT)-like permease [Aminobacter aganoensis]